MNNRQLDPIEREINKECLKELKESRELIVLDGEFKVPKKFYKNKKGYIVTQFRIKQMFKGRNITCWFRNSPEKPYLKDNRTIEFKQIGGKKELYQVKEITSRQLFDFLWGEK